MADAIPAMSKPKSPKVEIKAPKPIAKVERPKGPVPVTIRELSSGNKVVRY